MKNITTLKKQKIFIIVLSFFAVVIAAACIVLPVIFKEELNTVYRLTEYGDFAEVVITDKAEGRSLKGDIESIRKGNAKNTLDVNEGEGDVLYTFRKNDVEISYQPYIMPELQLSEIKEITVTNSYGSFALYNDGKENFFIKGAEKNLYNNQFLAELILQARYMLADKYVENPSSPSVYGLDEDTCSAKIEVLSKDGKKNVVYVGNKEIGGSRYYMKHAEKEQIYIMDSGAENFFNDVRFYLSPVVLKPIEEQQRNYIEKFVFSKMGERFFECEIIPDAERVGVYSNQLHRMTYPSEAHVLNTTTLYEMFSKVGGLSGAGVVEYGVSAKENKDEVFALYGIDTPFSQIEFNLAGQTYGIVVGKAEVTEQGDGYYYVYSTYQDTIVLVSEADLDFLGYEIVDLFQENVFQYNINSVSSIELKYGGKTVNYEISGEGEGLSVRESGKEVDVPSFRQFYFALLSAGVDGYSEFDAGVNTETLEHNLTFEIQLKSGENLKYAFYTESTLRCYTVINGVGEFYTKREYVDKIAKFADMLMSGQEIASQT